MNIKTNFESYSNSLYNSDADLRNHKSIFISIISYRDPNIINTLESLIINSKRPENLTISVVLCAYLNPEKWYIETESFINNLIKSSPAKIILKIVDASKTYNLGELKNISNKEYNKEDFYMSISSSSEFDPWWDDILIKQYSIIGEIYNADYIITADPRGFLYHDNIVPGYVFYTNHKTGMSLQREEYDGSKIPISGYNDFIEKSEEIPGFGLYNTHEKNENIKKTLLSESSLEKYNLILFNNRKFVKNEYIAFSSGISDRFIFSNAKLYFSNNKIKDSVIDKEDFNFISFINIIKNNITIFTLRWIPVYHLYDDESLLSIKRPSPIDNYLEKKIDETESYKNIQEIVSILNLDKEENFKINNLLGVDWNEKKFKKRNSFIAAKNIDAINNFISLYNFSTNENSLHWNNRLPK